MMLRRLLMGVFAIVMMVGFWRSAPVLAQTSYSGTVQPVVNCESPLVYGVVLDEWGNHLQDVRLTGWFLADGEASPIEYGTRSGTSAEFGASGWEIRATRRYRVGSFWNSEPRTGLMRVVVGTYRAQLSAPIEVDVQISCNDPARPSRYYVVFQRMTNDPPAPPLPTPPTGGSGQDAPPVKPGGPCRTFDQAAGGQGTFRVCDDGNGRFLSTLEQYGVEAIGYPISRRYMKDGFIMQAFQKAILQWNNGSVVFANTFDDLHAAGLDGQLYSARQTPNQLPAGWDGDNVPFTQVILRRQALLDARPSLRTAYRSVSDPMLFFGLPTSEVTDMGNHYAIRLQRAVLQEWKEDVPWARAGQVTIANGGDIAKEMGLLPAFAIIPEP